MGNKLPRSIKRYSTPRGGCDDEIYDNGESQKKMLQDGAQQKYKMAADRMIFIEHILVVEGTVKNQAAAMLRDCRRSAVVFCKGLIYGRFTGTTGDSVFLLIRTAKRLTEAAICVARPCFTGSATGKQIITPLYDLVPGKKSNDGV